MIYAGIGAQVTPQSVLTLMEQWANYLARIGYILRSGGCKIGADAAFEAGADLAHGPKHIFTPEQAKRNTHWRLHAASFHPNWSKCSVGVQLLHARNSPVILGANLDKPVDFVFCWTKNGEAVGGTGQALRIAQDAGIPVFNMFDPTATARLKTWLEARQ